jgi:hypothetical protein
MEKNGWIVVGANSLGLKALGVVLWFNTYPEALTATKGWTSINRSSWYIFQAVTKVSPTQTPVVVEEISLSGS